MATSQNYFSISLKETEGFWFVMWRPDVWLTGTTCKTLAALSVIAVVHANASNDRTIKSSGALLCVDM